MNISTLVVHMCALYYCLITNVGIAQARFTQCVLRVGIPLQQCYDRQMVYIYTYLIDKNLISNFPSNLLFDCIDMSLLTNTNENYNYTDIEYYVDHVGNLTIDFIIGDYFETLQFAANELGIPYIVIQTSQIRENMLRSDIRLVIAPTLDVIHNAVADYITKIEKRQFMFIYENNYALRIKAKLYSRLKLEIQLWKVNSTSTNLTETINSCLMFIRDNNVDIILVECTDTILKVLLKQALHYSMLTRSFHYICTDMKFVETDFTDYENTLGYFALVDFAYYDFTVRNKNDFNTPSRLFQDAIHLVSLTCNQSCQMVFTKKQDILCRLTTLKKMTHQLNTGILSFNAEGFRVKNYLGIRYINSHREVAIWSETSRSIRRVYPVDDSNEMQNGTFYTLNGRHINVVTITDDLFIRTVKTSDGRTMYYGFLIELMNEVAINLNFTYTIYECADGSYGEENDNGEWDGLVKEILVKNATIALAPLTISEERAKVIDFTRPYRRSSLSFLVRKPVEVHEMFQFLDPFTKPTWMVILGCMIAVGIMQYCTHNISKYVSLKDEYTEQSRISLSESVWVAYNPLVGAAESNLMPQTFSSRVLAGFWWFFSFVAISTYTANLVAFMTVTSIKGPIQTPELLAAQTQAKYGTMKKTSTSTWFENSKKPVLMKMWNFMSVQHPDSLVNNSEAGTQKAREENYYFIDDTDFNEQVAKKKCDLMRTGIPFHEGYYGLGIPKSSLIRNELDEVLFRLSDNNWFTALEKKWLKYGLCLEFQAVKTEAVTLIFSNFAGVYILVAVGCGISIICCCCEIILKIFRTAKRTKNISHYDINDAVNSEKSVKATISYTVDI